MLISMNVKKNIKNVLVVLFLFVGIFMPCLIRVRMQYVIFAIELIAIVYIFISKRKMHINVNLLKAFLSFIPFFLYYTLLVIIKGMSSDLKFSYFWNEYTQMSSIFLYAVVTAILIDQWMHKNLIKTDDFFKLLIIVSSIQLLCVVLAFMFPSVKRYFNSLTIRNSFSEKHVTIAQQEWRMAYRAFGLGENLYDRFGYVISILITITFLYGISRNNKRIVILSVIMFIMPVLNTRTGIVLSVVGVGIIMMRFFAGRKAAMYITLIIVSLVAFFLLFRHLPTRLQIALTEGMNATISLLKTEEKLDVYEEIFDNDIVIPKDIVLGDGISPEVGGGFGGIDSGYIQCLWRYGIVGSFLLLGAYTVAFGIVYFKQKSKAVKALVISILSIFFIYLFKLFSLVNYGNTFLLFCLLAAFLQKEDDTNLVAS